MSHLEIRLLDGRDAKRYYDLRLEGLKKHPENFSMSVMEWKQWDLEEVTKYLEEKDPYWTWGAFLNGELVGIVTLTRNPAEKENHKATIQSVYVSPKARGQRLGMKLIEKVVEFAEEHEDLWQLFLMVTKHNKPAIGLYKKMGFEIIGEQKHSLRVGDEYMDEYIMRRELHQDH